MLKYDEYQKKVAHFGHDLGKRDNISHSVLGMMSEVGELRELTVLSSEGIPSLAWVEELGDCFWFAAWYATAMGKSFTAAMELSFSVPPEQLNDVREALDHLEMAGCALLSYVKKHLFYKTEDFDYLGMNEEYLTYLKTLSHLALLTQSIHQFSIEDILDANFNKLDARYKGKGFSSDHAVNRDTQKEYEAMESSDGC